MDWPTTISTPPRGLSASIFWKPEYDNESKRSRPPTLQINNTAAYPSQPTPGLAKSRWALRNGNGSGSGSGSGLTWTKFTRTPLPPPVSTNSLQNPP
jgi:hypothetical protein